jgi:hypothetical protein
MSASCSDTRLQASGAKPDHPPLGECWREHMSRAVALAHRRDPRAHGPDQEPRAIIDVIQRSIDELVHTASPQKHLNRRSRRSFTCERLSLAIDTRLNRTVKPSRDEASCGVTLPLSWNRNGVQIAASPWPFAYGEAQQPQGAGAFGRREVGMERQRSYAGAAIGLAFYAIVDRLKAAAVTRVCRTGRETDDEVALSS